MFNKKFTIMTKKIKNHLHYIVLTSMRVYAKYKEAYKESEKQIRLKKLKKQPDKYIKICFIHTLND